MSETKNTITVFVNGKKRVLSGVNPRVTVLEYLRKEEGCTGTKLSCGQGGCGACTVLVTYYDEKTGKHVNQPANGCLLPLLALDGCNVTTTEGIGNSRSGHHPVQQRLAANNGSQCGFCTPGMVMSMYSLLQETEGKPTLDQVSTAIDGNICRCTGYRPIVDAFNTFAVDCKNCPTVDIEDIGKGKKFMPYSHEEHDKKPPAELKTCKPSPIYFSGHGAEWHRVVELQKALKLVQQYETQGKKYKLIVGNTMNGVYPDPSVEAFIDIKHVPELKSIVASDSALTVGAAVSIQQLISTFEEHKSKSPTTFPNIISHLSKISGRQVRGRASWVGGVMMCKYQGFASDTATVLYAAGTTFSVLEASGTTTDMDMKALLSYSGKGYIVLSLTVPFAKSNEHYVSYRTALRPMNSHALINAGFSVTMSGTTIEKATVVYGVVGKHPVRAENTERLLTSKSFDATTLEAALESIAKEIVPESEDQYKSQARPEGKEAYRKNLVQNFFYKFFLYMKNASGDIPANLVSGAGDIVRDVSTSHVSYPIHEDRPATTKLTAPYQASGEAKFTDDIPATGRTLYAAFVLSDRVVCNIKSVDTSKALAAPGVVDWVSADDIPGSADCGAAPGEEVLFAKDKVTYHGQPIGVVVAASQREANEASKLVTVEYAGEEFTKPILSIEDAIAADSFSGDPHVIKCGDVEAAWAECDEIITDTAYAGGQKHFYMERQSAYCIPKEGDGIDVFIGNQAPDYTRTKIASILGVSGNDVCVKTRRAGGAFGGKLSRHVYCAGACAVASKKLNRPIKLAMSIWDDCRVVGGRTEFKVDFKVGFKKDGTIVAVKYDGYGNSGMSTDFWGALVIEFNEELDGVYHVPNVLSTVKQCRTHIPSRTAVRSFGHIQAITITETVIECVAAKLGISPQDVREKNMYTTRNRINPCGQHLGNDFNIRAMYNKLKVDAEFDKRSGEIDTYNTQNKWKKRGISLMGIKYGCCQSYSIGTQALININGGDGTVVVYSGGVEIGQGLNTKVAQTVALTLGCDISMIRVGDSNTDVIPNTMFVGGSTASEANAEAARLACVKLNKTMHYVRTLLTKEGKPTTWKALCAKAKGLNMLLSATANFVPTGKRTSEKALPWSPFHADYFASGVACSEVEVDVLTGETTVRRVDILYDSAKSLNAIIDVGQAEGGFVTGIGYFLREEILTGSDGKLHSDSTWEYKPPCVADSPIDFRISLLPDSSFARGVLGSKAVGEPPVVLSYSVASAVKTAINASRKERAKPQKWALPAPFTVDIIQTAADISPEEMTLC